jgi:hypothetical protein
MADPETDSDEQPRRKKRSRGLAPLKRVVLFLFYEQHPLYQRIADVIGVPGSRPGQQVELRHYICRGHARAVEAIEAWVDDLNTLNPTDADKALRRGFSEPDPPLRPVNDSTERYVYTIYFNPDIPAERDVWVFLNETIPHMTRLYRRERLPGILKQMYLRQALVEGYEDRLK